MNHLPPIIRIEVDHMRQSMIQAFSKYTMEMDQTFQRAITEACQPEAVQAIVTEAARRYLREVLDAEVKEFVVYGEGRSLVRAEVQRRLNAEFGPQTP